MQRLFTHLKTLPVTPVVVIAAGVGFVMLAIHFIASALAPMPPEPPTPVVAPEIRVIAPPKPTEPPRLGFVIVFSTYGQPLIYEAVKGNPVYTGGTIEYTNTEGVFRRWYGGEIAYSTSPLRLSQEPVIKTMTATQFREH